MREFKSIVVAILLPILSWGFDASPLIDYVCNQNLWIATGNYISTNYIENGTNFTAIIWTNGIGTFVLNKQISVEALVVAGGGAGGYCAGGGAGGLVYTSSLPISVGGVSITVGNGGTRGIDYTYCGNNGGDSTCGVVVAIGGGGGAGHNYPVSRVGRSGGSGGGSAGPVASGLGTFGQGYSGGTGATPYAYWTSGGGGGGASAVGKNSSQTVRGIGGNGLSYSLSGANIYYAGGGGGGGDGTSSGTTGAGGLGGGGAGNPGNTGNATSGTANTGGGGGGCPAGYLSGLGGSGIVIVRFTQ